MMSGFFEDLDINEAYFGIPTFWDSKVMPKLTYLNHYPQPLKTLAYLIWGAIFLPSVLIAALIIPLLLVVLAPLWLVDLFTNFCYGIFTFGDFFHDYHWSRTDKSLRTFKFLDVALLSLIEDWPHNPVGFLFFIFLVKPIQIAIIAVLTPVAIVHDISYWLIGAVAATIAMLPFVPSTLTFLVLSFPVFVVRSLDYCFNFGKPEEQQKIPRHPPSYTDPAEVPNNSAAQALAAAGPAQGFKPQCQGHAQEAAPYHGQFLASSEANKHSNRRQPPRSVHGFW